MYGRLIYPCAQVGILGVLIMAAAAVLSAGHVPEVISPGYSLISTTVPLPPNDRGYVRVETKSGSTGCSINSELVACQTSANTWPVNPSGRHFHTASVNADGDFHWLEADLGALEGRVTLDYQTYGAQGWTILANSDGTNQSVKPF